MLYRKMVKHADVFEVLIFLPITISSVIVAQLWNRTDDRFAADESAKFLNDFENLRSATDHVVRNMRQVDNVLRNGAVGVYERLEFVENDVPFESDARDFGNLIFFRV